MHKHIRSCFLCLLNTALLAGLVSCGRASLPVDSPPDEPGIQDQPASQVEDLEGKNGGEGTGSLDEPVEAPPAGELLNCPPPDSQLYLQLDHAVTFNYESMSLSHFLHQGTVLLEAGEGGVIGTVTPGELKYSIEGVMGPECSISGEGQMTVTVEGACEDGVVKLKIDENWQALTGEMECDMEGEKSTVPFDAPSVGNMPNYGPDGEGETFLLTSDEGGYVVMRPFEQGQGYHTWTLYTSLIPTVPLAP